MFNITQKYEATPQYHNNVRVLTSEGPGAHCAGESDISDTQSQSQKSRPIKKICTYK